MVIPGSDGAELMDELKPSPAIRLDSSLLLSGHLQQIGTMEWIIGCNFPNCPRTTIYEASERDFRIILAKDATSLIYNIGLQELENIGVLLMNTDECIAWLVGTSYSKIQDRQ
ncbi:MAG: hypothetical protein K0S67_122 [Nitrososphaeraceae archaeon]|nr:hypothetical protein [Nitrososphaeraceae archaeon]